MATLALLDLPGFRPTPQLPDMPRSSNSRLEPWQPYNSTSSSNNNFSNKQSR